MSVLVLVSWQSAQMTSRLSSSLLPSFVSATIWSIWLPGFSRPLRWHSWHSPQSRLNIRSLMVIHRRPLMRSVICSVPSPCGYVAPRRAMFCAAGSPPFGVCECKKPRDPCEMAGLATVVTACALYTLLVRSLQAHHFILPGGRCAGIIDKSELARIAAHFHAKNISQII